MKKMIKNVMATCTLLISVSAVADSTVSTPYSVSAPGETVKKKARHSVFQLSLLQAQPETERKPLQAFSDEILLQTTESDSLLHKKLPGNLIATR